MTPRTSIYAPAVFLIAGMAGSVQAQGWYGGPYYGGQAPWTAPSSVYHRPPPVSAPRPAASYTVEEHQLLEAQLAASQRQLREIRNELEQSRMLLQQARSALEREQGTRHMEGSIQHTFGNQLTHLSSQQNQVHAQMKQLTEEVSALKTPLLDNRTQLADLAAIARALNDERDQLARLLGEMQAAREAFLQASTDLSSARDKTAMTARDAESCETRISELRHKMQDAIFDSNTSRQAMNDALAARENLQTELSRCAVKLADARAMYRTRHTLGNNNQVAGSPKPRLAGESVAMMAAEAILNDDDLDGDGIPNEADFCPDTPDGVSVGPTGCELPLPIVLEGISFHANSHQLNMESLAVLDDVAGTLARYPDLRLEVADFTDTQGSPAFNRSLSQQRAETVREYLVHRGIDADRLTAHGYGNTLPATGNDPQHPFRPGQPVTLRRID